MKGDKQMKLLITGGCGFIGTNTAVYFANKGWEIVVVDNLSRKGSEINAVLLSSKKNKIKLFTNVNIEEKFAQELIVKEEPDVIIHAGAQVAVTSSIKNPSLDFEINAKGTLNMLEGARSLSKKPIFIFTSTNKVYGEMKNIDIIEKPTHYKYEKIPFGVSEDQNIDFHSPYGCSKGCADQYVRDYFRIYGLPTVVFRQSCIYGLNQFGVVDQGWVSYLTMSALFGKVINVYGDGKQVRDLLFMDDLNRAFELAISNINKTAGQIYNIGGGPNNAVSLLEFLDFLKKKIGRKINFIFDEWRPGDQKIYISDIRKAKNDFGWDPEFSLNDGFEKMLGWIKKNEQLLRNFIV